MGRYRSHMGRPEGKHYWFPIRNWVETSQTHYKDVEMFHH